MTSTADQPLMSDGRPAMCEVDSCLQRTISSHSACHYDPLPLEAGDFPPQDVDNASQCVGETAKHTTLPCCTEPFCDLDFNPVLAPTLTDTCVDGTACFDFACLDEACMEYANDACHQPGCVEPATIECSDPDCEENNTCLQCLDNQVEPCTTCCMSDVCPHPSHSHYGNYHPPVPPNYAPWHAEHHHVGHHPHLSICSSERSSIEPRFAAALQISTLNGLESSPATTDTRSTPASSTDTILPDTPQRGGHRRLQGAHAQQGDGYFVCRWTTEPSTGMTCGHLFDNAKGLHEHIQATHFVGSASYHPCLWYGCDSGIFNTKPKLARHLHSHTEYKPHKCDFPGCSLSFVTQQQRDVHRKKHTGEKPFSCAECGKAFAYMDLLKSHMRSGVHGRADKKFACAICGEGFSDSSNRTKHTKSVHDPLTGVPCPEPGCTYVDTRREKLRLHCEKASHALSLVRSPREWENHFNREQNARRPNKGQKRKRPSHEGFGAF